MNKPYSVILAILGTLGAGASAYAAVQFISPFPSSVAGLTIRNAQLVGKSKGEVLRGMSPDGKGAELLAHGVTDVLIFKENYRDEVEAEKSELEHDGFKPEQIHNIPFLWKDIPSRQQACEQLIDALQLLETTYNTPGKSIYFHCTVGEDRTGMLAGLFRMVEQRWTMRYAFKNEMCLHGYAAGDPGKPADVDSAIQAGLTPLFLQMSTLVESGVIKAGHLDRSVCAILPDTTQYRVEDFVCKASPLYAP
jgi:hypothetical protein